LAFVTVIGMSAATSLATARKAVRHEPLAIRLCSGFRVHSDDYFDRWHCHGRAWHGRCGGGAAMNGGTQQFARVLESVMRPTGNMRWLENAGRVMAENKERWVKEDADNERQERIA
jgi:hypothetical protein